MTTHPEDTITNFPRDMQWGQAIQLIEDHMQASVDLNLDLARTLLTQSQKKRNRLVFQRKNMGAVAKAKS